MHHRKRLLAVLLLLIEQGTAMLGATEGPAAVRPGAELFEAGDFTAAEHFFQGVEGADKPWADYFLGRMSFENGDWDAAIERLTAAVEAAPETALFHRRLGSAYVEKINAVNAFKKMGVAKNARLHFEEAVRLAPADLEARNAWIDYLTNAPAIAGGSREKAEEQVAEFAALSPSQGAVLKARLRFNEGEWKEAEAAYARVIEADPGVAEYYYNLGFARQQQENYSGAVEAFEKALAIDADFLAALYQIGRSAALSGENLERGAQALQAYTETPLRRRDLGHEHAHWRLGMVYEHRGDQDKAAQSYRAALAIDPEHEEAAKALKKLE